MVVRCLCVSALDWRRSDPEKSTCVNLQADLGGFMPQPSHCHPKA